MKKLSILFLLLVLCVATLFAQAPEKLSYQAVVRSASNQLISNAPVGVRVSILQGSASGNAVYVETHTASTNANGLLTVEIGGGTVQQGVFADIDWSNGPFFLKTETDPAGGSNYTVTSTQQLLSVPYALYAKEAGNVPQSVGELTNDANYITISDIPEIPTVPTNVSAFFNDAGYITMDSVPTNVSAFANDAGYLTSFTETDPEFNAWDKDYNDLINKPTIPTVPDNVSIFVNDAGYITMDSVPTNVSAFANDAGYLTSFTETDPEFNAWDKDYNDLINKPTIPTVPDNVSMFINDAGYITMDSVPTNVTAFTNDAGYLTSFTETDPEFNAWDKDYNDLINKPTIPTVPTEISAFANDAGYLTSFTEQQVLSISNDTIFLTGGSFVKLPEGFDGDYNSLTNKPTIPTTVGELTNDANYITLEQVPVQVNADWDATSGAAQILNKPELFSGDYNDLTNTPTIPTTVGELTNDANYITLEQVPTQVNADWNATEGAAQILNKPELFSGDYNDLTNKPTIPTTVGELTNDANYITLEQVPAQVNADWNATTGAAQILNKPELFSGDYNDLTNKPTIPTVPTNVSEFNNDAEYVTTNQLNAANYITAEDVPAQVNADWNATEGAAQILNKPELFSGDYNDLTNKPAIPTTVGELTNDANYITLEQVPAQVNADWNATTGAAQILNKPELFSGDYNDLTNAPTIPTVPTNVSEFNNDAEYVTTSQLNAANYITAADVPAQVNADWNATEGAAQILNKPELFSGDYNDLTNTPTIPTVPANVSEFTNDANYITNSNNSCINSVDLCELLEKLELLENQLEPIMILTQGVTAVTQNSFTVNGKVQSDGSSTVTQRGFVYASSNPNPTLSDSHVNSGSGNGTFSSTITGLTAGITYYVRAYATNQNGTFYGSEVAVTTTATSPSTVPSVTTIAITNISINKATVKGAVTSDGGENVTQRGFVYDTLPNPTTSSTVAYHGTGVGQFSNLLSGLFSGKTYYVRAFATNSVGTAYGNEISFTTNVPSPVAGDAIPCPNTPTVTDHEGNVYNTVKIGTQCWTKENLRTTTSPSTGTYLIPPAGTEITHSGKQARWYNNDSATYAPKNCGLLYNWNAAMDTFNTMYGETSVNPNFYEGINVDVEFIGHRRGICPQGWHVPSSDEWTQLTDYLKSHEEYWKNGIADYIASSLASTTDWYKHDWEDCIYCPRGNPTDNNLSGFTAVPAGVIGGDQNEKDFSRITAFWSSNQTYWYGECALNLIVGGWDAAVIVTGPTKNSLLSVRCLRDETCGGSGTTATLPTVTTGSVSDVTATSAMCGGEVTADGGAEVTARGVCWGTSETPTVADAHTSDGTGIGTFTSSITGLTEGTTYYVRAYATNSEGTAYGDQLTFMTSSSTTPTPVDGDAIPCPGTPTVTDHEGNVYNTVQIGTQCWTKENLRTTTSPSTGTYLIPPASTTYTYTGKQARWYNNDSVTHASQIFNQSIVFSEDFSAVTDSASYTISNSLDNYTQIPGWIGNWVYPSNGKVKVGKSSSAGFIQTPALDLSANNGQFVVTFDAKAWVNDTTSLILEVDGVPYTVSGLSTTDFKTFSIPFYGGTESSVIKFQGCQVIKGGRFFLDNVYISTQSSVNYGLLYNWNAAVDTFNTAYGETSVNTSSSNAVSVTFSGHRRGICPMGWHLPSDAEWTTLTNYVSSQSEYTCGGFTNYIAKALASTEGWNTSTNSCAVGNNLSANNATGFSAVPAGICNGSSFYNAGDYALFWSSTQFNGFYAYFRDLYLYVAFVDRDYYYKYYGRSVRCLRD